MTILIILFLISCPVAVLLNAWVLTNLWVWFIVPFGIPAIGLAEAAGITLLVFFLAKDLTTSKKSKEATTKDIANSLIMLFVKPITVLGLGWVIQSFM